MKGTEKKVQKKPDKSIFTNRKREAKFWEKNFDRVWDKSKPAKITFAKNLSETINIRLEPDVLLRVRNTAKEKGLGPTQLIRTWIMEKINNGKKGKISERQIAAMIEKDRYGKSYSNSDR